jgi:hypothetical protein
MASTGAMARKAMVENFMLAAVMGNLDGKGLGEIDRLGERTAFLDQRSLLSELLFCQSGEKVSFYIPEAHHRFPYTS